MQAKIEELSGAVQECKAAAGTYGATFRRLEKEAADLQTCKDQLGVQAEQAVRAGDDQTARELLNEKVSVTQRLANLQPGLEQGRKTFDYLRDNLARLKDQLVQAKNKQAELRARQRSAAARKAFGQQMDHAQTTGGEMFDRMEDEVFQVEAEADVIEDINSSVDLEQRSRELQVDAEIAAMKQRLAEESK